MKVAHNALIVALLYTTLGVALPFSLVLTSDTPTIRFKNSALPEKRPLEPVHLHKPSFKQYAEQVREDTQSPAATDTELNAVEINLARVKPTAEAESETDRDRAFRDHYGAVLGKLVESRPSEDSPDVQSTNKTQLQPCKQHTPSRVLTSVNPVDLLDFIDKHGPECVAIAIFILVPIAYFLLELLELAIGSCVRERYPHRGRDRLRLLGSERQLRAWSNRQREEMLDSEKHWWQVRRHR